MEKGVLSVSSIGSFIESTLKSYVKDGNRTKITDIYIQVEPDSGRLFVLNDDDMVMSESIVELWMGEDDIYAIAEPVLRNVLNDLLISKKLECLDLVKPYSFVLIDKNKETVAELLLVDDQDTLLLCDELLKGLDEELNAFLKDLLEK